MPGMPGPFFWFFALVALVTLIMAIRFALRPAERTLAILRPLCSATICANLASFFIGLANGIAGLKYAIDRAGGNAAGVVRLQPILLGFMEAFGGLMLGFAVVAVAWLFVAVGLHRQP